MEINYSFNKQRTNIPLIGVTCLTEVRHVGEVVHVTVAEERIAGEIEERRGRQ